MQRRIGRSSLLRYPEFGKYQLTHKQAWKTIQEVYKKQTKRETEEGQKNTYPKESSNTKGSIPVRLLSVSVQIWLQQVMIYQENIKIEK